MAPPLSFARQPPCSHQHHDHLPQSSAPVLLSWLRLFHALVSHRLHRVSAVLIAVTHVRPFGQTAPTMASADFCIALPTPRDVSSTVAAMQISPGITHPPSRSCLSDIRRVVPCKYRALAFYAASPQRVASYPLPVRLGAPVEPALCLGLPSDSQSPTTPLPLANTSPCRVCRGLSPPSECALPGAHKKGASEDAPETQT